MTEFLLRLNIPPSLEEDMVDLLLSSEEITGYQSYPTRGHGRVGAMSIAEQVAGRRDRIQFEIVLDEDVLESTLEMLKGVSHPRCHLLGVARAAFREVVRREVLNRSFISCNLCVFKIADADTYY